MPVIDLNKIKTENHWTNRLKDKAKAIGKKIVQKTGETVEFAKENPQAAALIVGGVTTVAGGVKKVLRTIDNHAQRRHEQYHRDREIYDHSLNMYLTTKKKLSKKDVDRINEMMRKTGKKKSEVLSDLGLLK